MQTEQIVSLLVAERDRLSRAIDALQGPTKRRGRPPKNAAPAAPDFNHNAPDVPDWVKPKAAAPVKKRKRTMSPDVRARMAAGQKRRWAAIKAGKGKK